MPPIGGWTMLCCAATTAHNSKLTYFDNPCTSSSEKVLHGILFRGGGLVGRHGGGDESMNQASIEATEVWREGWIG
jgi:hypothetical protein